jgi:uncharacterized peroxidase-related enzyme
MSNSALNVSTLPEPANQHILNKVAENVGFIPNLFTTLARQRGTVESFAALDGAFVQSSLSPIERQVVLLAASVENVGRYCVAGHTLFARKIGMPEATITALRNASPVEDERLAALQSFVQQLIQLRGHVTPEQTANLMRVGFTREQLMDVVMGITLKTFSNYVDSAMGLTLDEQFADAAWSGTAKEVHS